MTTLKITGMTCDSCAVHVKEVPEKVPGIQSANISYIKDDARFTVETGTLPDALTAAVAELGYRATLTDALMPPVGGGLFIEVVSYVHLRAHETIEAV